MLLPTLAGQRWCVKVLPRETGVAAPYMKPKTLALLAIATSLAVPLAAGAHHRPDHGGNGSLSIAADPSTITFGGTTTLSGRLAGSANGGVTIELQGRPHPYTAAFATLGTTTTSAAGAYSFAGVKPLLHTRYRVIARTTPPETSGEVTVLVRIRAGLRVSDSTPRRGQLVRFSGFARPQHDGALVSIQRRTSTGGWDTVARTRLVDAGDDFSRFSRRIRVYRDGVYRALVAGDADHARGATRAKRLDVR